MARLTRVILPIAAGAALAGASAPSKPSLLPLKEYDANKIDGTGCAFSFERKDGKSMFTSIGNTLMVRTGAGLRQCTIAAGTFESFRSARGSVVCGGQRLSLRKVGRQIDPREGSEEDGSSYPARLTIGTGSAAVTLPGSANTAC